MGRFLLALLILPLVLSGCAGPSSVGAPSKAAAAQAAGLSPGHVLGLVKSDLGLPLPAVDLLLEPVAMTATTDDQGHFEIRDLAPGDYRLRATRAGYDEHVHPLTVPSGSRVDVTIVLALLDKTTQPSIETNVFQGFIQCSANAVYAVDPCEDTLGTSRDSFAVQLDLARDPRELLLELDWTSTSAVTAQQLQLDVCPPEGNGPGEIHCAQAAVEGDFHRSVSGTSPITMRIEVRDWPSSLTQLEAWIGNGRLSPYPTVAQPFVLYTTTCYSAPCPEGFSAIPA